MTQQPRLPPMHALRAFEAASRHLSFSRAAEELHLTHGAVSHALRALEADLGTALFRRHGNGMLLTDAGQRLAVHVRDGLARLTRGLEELGSIAAAGRQMLTISVLPAFASRWLLLRLAGFYALHPTIDVLVHATPALADFPRENVDLAIRYGPGGWPGLEAEKLFDERIFPVCSPAFLERYPLRKPADLLCGTTLLRNLRQPWADWFSLTGLPTVVEPTHGPAFNDAGLLLEAAASGHGVALARERLVREDLRSGRLIRLFVDSMQAEYAYYLVRPASLSPAKKIVAFTQWIKDQVAAEKASAEGEG